MQVKTREHYELIEQFESEFPGRHDKEDRDLWRIGRIYQDGQLNELFLAYRRGYALAQAIYGR